MNSKLDLAKINTYLENKIKSKDNKIICTYYEVKFQLNISKKDETIFLKIARDKFQEYGYDVYFANAKYKYNDKIYTVESNKMIVAIKYSFYH